MNNSFFNRSLEISTKPKESQTFHLKTKQLPRETSPNKCQRIHSCFRLPPIHIVCIVFQQLIKFLSVLHNCPILKARLRIPDLTIMKIFQIEWIYIKQIPHNQSCSILQQILITEVILGKQDQVMPNQKRLALSVNSRRLKKMNMNCR